MCGIVGILGDLCINKDNICNMCNALRHRGPDGQGFYFDKSESFALGHRRLSIIDLSENGTQPMMSSDGRWVISFNGEIYNHVELRQKFLKDTFWKGTSDTETLTEMISELGIDKTLEEIRGMFAIAVWDKNTKTLYLIRDAMGEKPLYYGQIDHNFIFASELSAIEALDNFDKRIDADVLGTYFRYGYIPAPMSIYKEVKKLPPGSILYYQRGSKPVIRKWWDIEEIALAGERNPFVGTFDEATEELERLLKGAVSEQMKADVPYGGYLSAGIDSSTIVSVMQSVSSVPVNTFSIGIKGAKDEAVIARKSSDILGTCHHEHYLTLKDVVNIVPQIADIYAEPFADNSAISTYLLSIFAKKCVTVSLSGDGGDELFGGYDIYYQVKNWWEIVKNNSKSIAEQRLLTEGIPPYKAKKYINCSCIEDIYLLYYDYDEVLGKMNVNCPDKNTVRGIVENDIEKLMLLNQKQYMPDDCLAKVDRAGMAVSMENRIPFLDKRIVEFSWKLPAKYKFENGCSKKILRSILYKYLPQEMMERPKCGFNIPMSQLMKDKELRMWAEDIMATFRRNVYLDTCFIDRIWKEYREYGIWKPIIFYYLILADWCERKNKY